MSYVPLRRVIGKLGDRVQLECGHTVPEASHNRQPKHRRCRQCAHAYTPGYSEDTVLVRNTLVGCMLNLAGAQKRVAFDGQEYKMIDQIIINAQQALVAMLRIERQLNKAHRRADEAVARCKSGVGSERPSPVRSSTEENDHGKDT